MHSTTSDLQSFDELLDRIGGVPISRIRMEPPPGTATPEDALLITETIRPCELVDGVLVTKASDEIAWLLSPLISSSLLKFLEVHDLGIVSGTNGLIRFGPNLVRSANVYFIPYENIPPDADPSTPIPDWVPALAIEIISRGNTKREIERKLRDYFAAGVQLVWCFYPQTRNVTVFTSADQSVKLGAVDVLDGGNVLPGFSLEIGPLFDRAANTRGPA